VITPNPDRSDLVLVRPLLPPIEALRTALSAVLESGVLTNDGPRVTALEELLSAATGIGDIAVCASGTTAIQLACSALEMTGDVLVPAAAFPAVAQAVLRAGGRPIAVDVEPTHLTIDPAAARAALTSRTTGIVAIHTFGCPADVQALQALARSAGIPLVCDAAPCWGVRYRGRSLLSYGDVATLSLHATKLMHSIEGGAVIGNTCPLGSEIRRLRSFGPGRQGASPAATNARMSELHAAVGATVLVETTNEIARRMAVRERYLDALSDLGWLSPVAFRPLAGPNVAAFPVRLADDAPFDAATLCANLLRQGVHARAYFTGRYRVRGIATAEPIPHADAAARRVICLPFWGGLTEQDIARVVGALWAACAGKGKGGRRARVVQSTRDATAPVPDGALGVGVQRGGA
jgi:dTDP-4-amino-4,6-dideoxygalactose transaminase